MTERIFQKNKRKKLDSSPGQDNSSEASPVEKIIFGVSLWKDDCKEIEGSLSALADAVYATAENAEKNRTTFSNIGGGRFLVCAMERFLDNRHVQAAGCRVFANASHENPAFRAFAKECGGLDVIARAMKNHGGDQDVQCEGCLVLANLFADETNAEYIVQKCEGIQLIVDAMNRFSDVAGVQEHGCLALANLSELGNFNETIKKDHKGHKPIFAAISKFEDESNPIERAIQEFGGTAVGNLYQNR